MKGTTNFFGKDSTESTAQTSDDGINYNPPTEEEANAGNEQKDRIVQENQSPQEPDSNKKEVTVLITDAGQYDSVIEVRSFVPDYFEDGTCTLQFSKGSTSFQKEVPAFTDSSTTICTNPDVDRSEFNQTGEWTVKVTYESPTARAESTKSFIIE